MDSIHPGSDNNEPLHPQQPATGIPTIPVPPVPPPPTPFGTTVPQPEANRSNASFWPTASSCAQFFRKLTTPTERRRQPQPGAGKAIIYRSELDYISRCILDRPDIETGGQLFGYWNDSGVPIVLYALGPGPRANHQLSFFLQDIDYLERIGNTLLQRYGLTQIGEWHSHHRLGLAQPSGHDAQTMFNGVNSGSFKNLLLCIGNCNHESSTLNAFIFSRSNAHSYNMVPWDIKEMGSPFRSVIDHEMAAQLFHPHRRHARHGNLHVVQYTSAKRHQHTPGGLWFSDKQNGKLLKNIYDALLSLPEWSIRKGELKIDTENKVHIFLYADDAHRELIFPDNFPQEAPVLILTPAGGEPVELCGYPWTPTGDICRDVLLFCRNLHMETM